MNDDDDNDDDDDEDSASVFHINNARFIASK